MSTSNQNNLTLDDVRQELSQEIPENPHEKYFLLSNPFPVPGQFYGTCVDQEAVEGEFTRVLRNFYQDSQLQIMTMLGSTGAGKTNLLRYLEQKLRSWREPDSEKKAITDLFTIFIEQPQGSYLDVHRQIIGQFSTMFFTEFFSIVQHDKIDLSKLSVDLPGTNPELIHAIVHIAQVNSRQLLLEDHRGQTLFLSEPQPYRILEKWLQGVKLTTNEKKLLGNVSTEVGKSATVAIKFLSDLVKIFLHVRLFKGIIIFFDEFEELVSGRSSISQAQYSQDLRNLFDSHPKGVVFVVATAPISEKLQKISPALDRRLGPGIEINPISDETTALKYAKAYIKRGRDRYTSEPDREIVFPKDCLAEDQPYYPLTNTMIKKVYNTLKEDWNYSPILPGDLLPKLHHLLYQRVYEEK